MVNSLTPNDAEMSHRDKVIKAILDHVESGTRIKLPDFDRTSSVPAGDFALHSVGSEPNLFGGQVGLYRYQFEGEEDLLHLFVMRPDAQALAVSEGQAIAAFLLQGVPPALVWLRPGEFSQHFYVAQDDLLEYLSSV